MSINKYLGFNGLFEDFSDLFLRWDKWTLIGPTFCVVNILFLYSTTLNIISRLIRLPMGVFKGCLY